MKSLLVATFVTLVSLGAAAQTTHMKFTQEAEFASLNQNPGPNSSFQLQVSRNAATGTTTSASINYIEFDFAADFSSVTFIQIVGGIPTSTFTGQTTNDLTLTFNTSQLDPMNSISQSCQLDPMNSISQSCPFSFVTFTQTCGPAPAGAINVEWKGNSVVSSEVAIIREDTMGGITTKIHQHSDNSSGLSRRERHPDPAGAGTKLSSTDRRRHAG